VPSQPTTTPAPTETPLPTATARPPTNTPLPTPTQPAFLPTVTPRPFTPLPPAPIIGNHVVQGGETVFCIGRGYGVLPAAIIQANGLSSTGSVFPGQELRIPQIQWVNIGSGPVCAPQFSSPFPGLPAPTATSQATPIPAGPLLALNLEWHCTVNCGSSEGTYTVLFTAQASGGVEPYRYDPASSFELTFNHCTDHSGTVSVTSADGQTASRNWDFHDVNCASP
jgi:LysM repeat protein